MPPWTRPGKKLAPARIRHSDGSTRCDTFSQIGLIMTNNDHLLRELNHRVQNNFQIIVSLMNLKKRMLPADRQGDIRFIEEHVQSMAIAYKLVYATGDMVEVSTCALIEEILSGLRHIAGLGDQRLKLEGFSFSDAIGLDQAIALGLYLAIIVPPLLDQAQISGGTVHASGAVEDGFLTLSVVGNWHDNLASDFLRNRLTRAYVDHLHAELLPATEHPGHRLRFPLDPRRAAILG